MKLKIKVLTILGSLVLLMLMTFVVNVETASAHPDANPNFQGEHADDPSPSPVGKHLGAGPVPDPTVPGYPGLENGLENENSSALDALAQKPNCPLHHH